MCHITLKTILREVHPIKGFVYQSVTRDPVRPKAFRVQIAERQGCWGICSGCGKKGPGYDRQPERQWDFIPLWGMIVFLVYALRRIDCSKCGPTIERVPWATGKYQICDVFRLFLAQWARLLSWAEVARCFRASWADVYGAVKWVVEYGIENRDLSGVQALGVDEIHVGKKDKFWTLVYQIDDHCKRLLWVGTDRTEETFNLFFEVFGTEFCKGIRFICSDMWKPYIKAAAAHLPHALQILDPFHIVKKLNDAVDEIRREETRARVQAGLEPLLKKMRWAFLKRRCNWTKGQRRRMREIEGSALRTLRAFLLVEAFRHFWTYCSPTWAGKFLDAWCEKVARSRLDPLKKVARTLQSHRCLLLNYFKAAKQYSSGVVEGLNAKVKLTLKRSYGFRTENAREVALYHCLGKLPEPSFTHSFF
jgi:transposase